MKIKRRYFLAMASGGIVVSALKLNSIKELGDLFKKDKKNQSIMPSVFIGHGSPMNAIENNSFTKSLNTLGEKIGKPQAILCISAHWMTRGTWITGMENPKTIHDFYGFPQELFDVQYKAPGDPMLASLIHNEVKNPLIQLDQSEWGLDHGTWSVLKHMYPNADVPVLQLSLNINEPPEYHFNLGAELKKLRENGVMILGSGNIVHNLRMLKWDKEASPYDWAIEFDQWSKEKLMSRDFKSLQTDILKSEAGRLSIPTMDHYYPLLYVLGASSEKDELNFVYEGVQNSSISMRSMTFGPTKS